MSFSSFKLVNVPLAINASILDPEDNGAASSLPNALLGSPNFSSHGTIPRIYVANNCSCPLSNCTNDFPHPFHPISMRINPIDFLPSGVFGLIDVVGWELDGKEVLNMYSCSFSWGFTGNRSGHFGRSLKLTIDRWGEGKGKIHVLEIKSRDNKGKDRRFTVDDLELSNSAVEG
jgi:hypothetical protein